MPKSTLERILYTGILLTYLVLGILFAIRTPDWQAPDEPAHYNYIAQVASGDFLPTLEMGDWDNDYLETLKAEDFAPELLDRLDSVQYEDHQPPLYYWLATPIFWLTNGSLTAIRLYSVLLGGITVALSFAVTSAVFPNRPQIAFGAMALVAFLPQQLHMTSTVNNDALAGVLIGMILLACIRYLTPPLHRRVRNEPSGMESDVRHFAPSRRGLGGEVWHLGLLTGIAFITKTTTYFMAGVVVIVIFMRWRTQEKRAFSTLFRTLAQFAIPAGIFALLYWGRNIAIYGMPDFLGLQRHDAVVIGQKRTAELIAEIGSSAYWQQALKTTFHSFWGQFGWMEARMADAVPLVIAFIGLLLLAAVSGLVMYAAQPKNDAVPRTIWITLGLVMLLAMLQYIYYNLTFVQFQGRYLFTGLIPFALCLALGVDVWRKLILGKIEILSWATVAVFLLFAPLDLYLIWRVIPGAVGGI
jgi:4-amino-4-deoxy-L-arabinose transferase-like glycosyltransferase